MKPYLFKIGAFELRYYSLMYILAFLIGIYIASKDLVARKRGVTDKKMIEDYAFWAQKYSYVCNSQRGDPKSLVIFSNESFDKGEFILL